MRVIFSSRSGLNGKRTKRILKYWEEILKHFFQRESSRIYSKKSPAKFHPKKSSKISSEQVLRNFIQEKSSEISSKKSPPKNFFQEKFSEISSKKVLRNLLPIVGHISAKNAYVYVPDFRKIVEHILKK